MKKIKSVKELKTGDCVLVKNPMTNGDTFGVVVFTHKVDKYPFTDNDGKKSRTETKKNGQVVWVYPEQENCVGNEKIKELDIMSEFGDYNFNEDKELTDWNVRRINSTHPLYNKLFVLQCKTVSATFNIFKKLEKII